MGVFGAPLIPFLSLIKPRVRRPGPGSESAQQDSDSVSPSLALTWGSESRIRVSQRQSWILCWCVQCLSPPECFSLLAVRCIPLPQGGRATGPLPGAGYRAGAGGTPLYPEVGRGIYTIFPVKLPFFPVLFRFFPFSSVFSRSLPFFPVISK